MIKDFERKDSASESFDCKDFATTNKNNISERTNIVLTNGWKFTLNDEKLAWQKSFDDSNWEEISIPHDWSVTKEFDIKHPSGTGYLIAGTGYYRKSFFLDEISKKQKVILTFDGIYNNSMVWINGYYLGKRPSGYAEIVYDITDFCCFGNEPNVITVKVEHKDNGDSRWFTGSGIYRKVSVCVKNLISIDKYGVFYDTLSISQDKAEIIIKNSITNDSESKAEIKVTNSILDSEGNSIFENSQTKNIEVNEKINLELISEVINPIFWSIENPYLYKLITKIEKDNILLDLEENNLGIRTIKFDVDKGFFLNEASMKLKGVCVHHDAGCLGAAVRKEVWFNRLKTLKELGCNAIRMSHNPHMPELYELCDCLGFLVIDEAFDEWEGVKNKWHYGHNVYPPNHYGYYEYFPQWHKIDLENMILRDRNHPSVILWSIGNEIDYPNDPYCHPSFSEMVGNNDKNKPSSERKFDPTKPNAERLVSIAKNLYKIVKNIDNSRPVTAALAFPELSNNTGLTDCLDVVGFNYKEHLYEESHKQFPTKPILGSENGKELSHWLEVKNNDYISGQFLWTGIDFLGETLAWPFHGSQAGILDLCGFKKPTAYFRKSLWSNDFFVKLYASYELDANKDSLSLTTDWNFAKNQKVKVIAFTNLDSCELFLNKKSLGIKNLKDFSKTNYLEWEVDFEIGELKIKSVNNTNLFEDTLKTVGIPVSINLEPDKTKMKSDGRDMLQVVVNLLDHNDNIVYNSKDLLFVNVCGAGKLLGIENGDITDTTSYFQNFRRVVNGKLLFYISSTTQKGECIIEVKSNKLKTSVLKILVE